MIRQLWRAVTFVSWLVALTVVFLLLIVLLERWRGSGDAKAATAGVHLRLWLCVHAHEHSAWNDPNAPYYGGLQLGTWFVSHYGALLRHPAGTPDRWTPAAQIAFAEGAYRIEHYSRAWLAQQWPPSVGACF